jgi:uncharacterized protein (TIGR03083 family)
MTKAAEALSADRDVVLGICAGLDGAGWTAPSGCPGWTVQDVVSHLGALFWAAVDRGHLPDAGGRPTEQAGDFHVESRRHLSPAEIAADYESISARALDVLASWADLDMAVPLGDLGTYPLSTLPAAYCFDHYVHIRSDLFAPRGPLPGPVPESDELRLAFALDWIEAALPQQNADALAGLDGPVEFVITGPAARTFSSGPGPALATVTCAAPEFTRAVTQRETWESAGARLDGDPAARSAIPKLRIF